MAFHPDIEQGRVRPPSRESKAASGAVVPGQCTCVVCGDGAGGGHVRHVESGPFLCIPLQSFLQSCAPRQSVQPSLIAARSAADWALANSARFPRHCSNAATHASSADDIRKRRTKHSIFVRSPSSERLKLRTPPFLKANQSTPPFLKANQWDNPCLAGWGRRPPPPQGCHKQDYR